MEHYRIFVSESYHRDLENIIYYISHNFDAPYTAADLLDDVEDIILSLSTMPYRHGLVSDSYLRHKEFRKCVVKNYVIFYKIQEGNKSVLVHRILHMKQNWIDIL